MLGFIKKLALRSVMDKAKGLHKAGNSVEQIAEKFWANEQVATGLIRLNISPDELIKMIKDKVKEK